MMLARAAVPREGLEQVVEKERLLFWYVVSWGLRESWSTRANVITGRLEPWYSNFVYDRCQRNKVETHQLS